MATRNHLQVPGANMNMDGGSDVPSPTRSAGSSCHRSHHSGSHHSHSGFKSGSKSGSVSGSKTGSSSEQHPNFPPPLGYDLALGESSLYKTPEMPKNLDLPPEAYQKVSYSFVTDAFTSSDANFPLSGPGFRHRISFSSRLQHHR
jgi:hypothetical protein